MKTREKIQRKGYSITSNMGYKDGVQCIVSYTAKKGHKSFTERNVTTLLRSIN